jgi:Arc/MetJ family transcription regulator
LTKSRSDIELDDTLLATIMDRYGVRTKTAAVDLALRQLAGQPMSRDEALAMRGARAIADVPPDAGLVDSIDRAEPVSTGGT